MSGLGSCRDCGEFIYWQEYQGADGRTKRVPFDEPGFFTMHWATCTEQDYVEGYDGGTYRVTQCRDCRDPVYWVTTARGKKRPMDCHLFGDEFIDDGATCHFETCRERTFSTNNWRAHDSRRATNAPPPPRQPQVPANLTTCVATLGLGWPCTRVDVISAFRKKALETHPDMGGTSAAFIKVKRAYDALVNLVPA